MKPRLRLTAVLCIVCQAITTRNWSRVCNNCERRTREGHRGEIRRRGDDTRTDLVGHDTLVSPRVAAGVTDRTQLLPMYALADAPETDFEEALAQAREGQP